MALAPFGDLLDHKAGEICLMREGVPSLLFCHNRHFPVATTLQDPVSFEWFCMGILIWRLFHPAV